MSKFKPQQITEILKEAYRTSSQISKAAKISPELREKLVELSDKIRDSTESISVSWTDQLGGPGERAVGPMSCITMLKGMTEIVSLIESSKFWEKFDNSLEFALLMGESVEGIGPARAMCFKALLDGCSREDSITIHVMQSVFGAGVKAWGDKPWERSAGHTIWAPKEVLETLMFLYKFSQDEAKTLAKFLLERGLIGQYAGMLALPNIHSIEKQLIEFSENVYSGASVSGSNTEKLTQEQIDILTKLESSAAQIVCIKGPGGTGKTHTISRYIKAAIDSEVSVLCCAPTGISAKVLNDSLKCSNVETSALVCGSVVVLDRAIALAKFGSLDADILVIDEASMVSTEHLAVLGLLWSLKRLILLGDPSQLRPVEPGQPFMDLLGLDSVSVLELYTNMRANGEKLAKELAVVRGGIGLIHQNIPMAASSYTKDHGILKSDPRLAVKREVRDQFRKWVASSVGKGYVWLAHSNAVCNALADLNLGMLRGFSEDALDGLVCNVIGAYFGARPDRKHQRIDMDIDGLRVYWTGDREGEKVRVYRGFTGIIQNGFVRMEAIDMEGFMTTQEFPLERIESKIMPWMIKTVHKSQGQSIENVVYLIKAGMGGKHSAELAYTAHSRAKSDCIVVSLCAEKKNPKLTADSKRRTSIGTL